MYCAFAADTDIQYDRIIYRTRRLVGCEFVMSTSITAIWLEFIELGVFIVHKLDICLCYTFYSSNDYYTHNIRDWVDRLQLLLSN